MSSNPCLSCGACCASFRVDFDCSELESEGGRVPGQVVGVREKAKSLEVITDSLAGRSRSSYSWLEWNQASLSGKFLSAPQREDIPEEIKEQLIVELYSK